MAAKSQNIAKPSLESHQETRWISVMLGAADPQ